MRKLSVFLLGCVVTVCFANNLTVDPYQVKQAEKQFIHQLVIEDHFNKAQLNHLFQTLHEDPKVIQAMTRPFEKEPWTYYRHFFVTPERVDLGAKYLKDHHTVLMQMQKKYGIPASIIVAILGVETEYGEHLGVYPVLSTLYTLGFYYPPRETFFRKELAQYLILTRDNHLNAKSIKGSYAGALGIPQFMPSSYRSLGVALHPGEPVNLFNNNDAIASVANYFHRNGWEPNQPITRLMRSKYEKINSKMGRRLALPLKQSMQYWETFRNFNVIMSYNHNVVYAMAVYQLSQQIEKRYEQNFAKIERKRVALQHSRQ